MNEAMASLRAHPKVKNLRQAGMIWAFEVDSAEPDFAKRLYLAGLERELLLRPIGNTVYFMPPYTISESEIDFMIDVTLNIIKKTI